MLDIKYPVVIKIPDGSFSRGVFKAENEAKLIELTNKLFKESDLILAQEYLYTEFDWRVGILNGQPLYVCQYFMSKAHWQIVRHEEASGKFFSGAATTHLVEDAPPGLLKTALNATNLIGDGFYGVDIKQTEKGFAVIEINDNPSVDTGCEDVCLGNQLYDMIMLEFLRRMQLRRIR
jgi:glutathione synthase/RimK-type ligase-like ATP-grasp enzyme